MPTITNDQELKEALQVLSPEQHRVLGARFVQSISRLVRDERVQNSIAIALRDDATPEELEDAFKVAKSHVAKSYTECGRDTEWLAQADHFAACAIAGALTPEALLTEKENRAWTAAAKARMAVNCEMVVADSLVGEVSEAQRQYDITADFLAARA